MPITRTAIVDDDGSGTTGTVLDNAWKQELYNQIDALTGPLAPAGAWTPYTPTWKSTNGTPAIGNGTLMGRYVQTGKTVTFVLLLALGSTTTQGGPGGVWYWSLPFGPNQNTPVAIPALNFVLAIMSGGGAPQPAGLTYHITASEFSGVTVAGGAVGPGIPVTFTSGFTLVVRGTYEAA